MHNQRAIRGQGASLGKTIRNISNIPGYPSQWLLFLLDHLHMERLEGSLPFMVSREFLKSHFEDIWLSVLLYNNQRYGKVIPVLSVLHFCKMPDFPSKQNKAT